jgi:excisionase family DNA binding protein
MSAVMDNALRSFTTSAGEESRADFERGRATNENALTFGEGDPALDVHDVARLLRVGRNAVYELVARNQVPHRRIGKQIRFSRSAIIRWLAGTDAP